jgi:tRNA threonylcarbamoyl adenosine modification protein (Sua5/YciO/YrdC/YwlC family)
MRRIQTHMDRLDPRLVAEVARDLENGAVAAIPTDTVYAFACDIASKRGVERLYQVKEMDRRQLLAFLLPDLSNVARYAVVSDYAYRVMRRLLPGPYCIVLEATREVPKMLLDRRRVVGIRVPEDAFSRALLDALGRPTLVSAATAPGEEQALKDPDSIADIYGARLDILVDVGPLGDVPSTILSLIGDEMVVVREGKGGVEQ